MGALLFVMGVKGTKESEIELRPEEERKPKGMYKGEVVYEVPEPTARGSDLEIPDSRDYATGMERLEIELGTDRIAEGPEGLVGKFGTAEEPSFIESAFGERIVGCTGILESSLPPTTSFPVGNTCKNVHHVILHFFPSSLTLSSPLCCRRLAFKCLNDSLFLSLSSPLLSPPRTPLIQAKVTPTIMMSSGCGCGPVR